jgi:hypothetical protein
MTKIATDIKELPTTRKAALPPTPPLHAPVAERAGIAEAGRARRGRATTCGFFDPALRKASVSPPGVCATATHGSGGASFVELGPAQCYG